MKIQNTLLAFLFTSILLAQPGWASDQIPGAPQQQPIALVGGTVYTVAGPVINNCVVLFENGKITAVGAQVSIPSSAKKIDVSGKSVYPGLFAVNTQLGLTEIEAYDMTQDHSENGSFNPNARTFAAFNPDSELIPVARANGITHAQSTPRNGVIPGQSGVMMLDGWTWEDMSLKAPASMQMQWPNMGINREREGDSKKSRDNRVQAINDFFDQARAYWTAKRAAEDAGKEYHPTDIRFEAMIPVLKKELPLVIEAGGILEIQAAILFAEKQDVKIMISGGADAWRIADDLIEHDVPVIVWGTQALEMRPWEPYDKAYSLPAKLYEAGVKFCIGMSKWGSAGAADMNVRNLPYQAGSAAAYGLPKDEALKSITLYPAQMFGIADQVGSIETGKNATLIVTSGDPLEVATQVEQMYIQGRAVDLTSRHTQLYDKYEEKYRQLSQTK